MKENLKKLAKYYKPYLGTFILDMILAMMSAAVALVIPLVVRFITSKVAYMSANEALSRIMIIVGVLFVLVLIQWGCNYYISNYGHVMGAKIEYDMMASFTAEDKAALAEETPVGRLGTAEEVAKLLLYLAGEDAGYITGQVFGVNGGLVI